MLKKLLLILLFLNLLVAVKAQQSIKGIIKNDNENPIAEAKVQVQNTKISTLSSSSGNYSLKLNAGDYVLNFSAFGHDNINVEVKIIAGKDFDLSVTLKRDLQILEQVIVQDQLGRNQGMMNLNPKLATSNPNISQSFEAILKQLPGVSTNNELSSQYSVRGGNFDENLIYINDVEIYKPYLVRNGQQEGLSLINPDMIGNVKFSAGGFVPRYGDKLSSVLDVQYKTADSTNFIVGAGTNGYSLTAFLPHKKVNVALGFRQKQNTSILNSQPVIGSYNPQFYDFQTLINVPLSKKTNLSFLGIYNTSKFGLVPQSRETQFGTFNDLLRLRVNYEGQEIDEYNNLVSSFTLNANLSDKLNLKWVNSIFLITEKENFDILGQYIFDEIENDFSSNNFGQVKANRGIGAYQNYGRNELRADVYASELKINYTTKKSYWETGFRLQYDKIADDLKEFELIDSAGFSIPNNFQNFVLSQSVQANNQVNTTRYSAYLQNTADLSTKITYTGGIRLNYNSFTKEFLISPRIVFAYRPNYNKDLIYKFATGLYAQPPFYREARNFDGSINLNLKSQKSLHFVLSSDYQFKALGTNLTFTTEAYFKYLYNITPYDIENLRVRYYANQQAKGYATGLDFRINGEFIKNLESSFRLSIMKTAEDIENDSFITTDNNGVSTTIFPGYIKRPTDQRVNFSAFFQDKLFNSPTYKVHLNLLFGSRLPTGPPKAERYQQTFSIPAYKRLDIGFSKDILDPESRSKPKLLIKYFKSVILHAEIFNLLNINNTVSYLWITDVNNIQFAIPNYLTARQINVRMILNF
jgi:hypothetical protein